LGFLYMVGWRHLNDSLKALYLLGFIPLTFVLFPHLFPRFGLDTPPIWLYSFSIKGFIRSPAPALPVTSPFRPYRNLTVTSP
jgi:hypothetical protein